MFVLLILKEVIKIFVSSYTMKKDCIISTFKFSIFLPYHSIGMFLLCLQRERLPKWQYAGASEIQSTLVISKLKGPSETLRDIRTSTYQIIRISEESTNRTTRFQK